MTKKSVTIKTALIGFAGIITVAIVSSLFSLIKSCGNDKPYVITPTGSNMIVIFDSTVKDNVIRKIVPQDQILKKERPSRFDLADPQLKFLKRYDLRKEAGALLTIGACPKYPCFGIKFNHIDSISQIPKVTYSIWSRAQGKDMDSSASVGLKFSLMKSCGFTYAVPGYLFMLEITDDNASTMSATLAIKSELTTVKGLKVIETGCKR